jgi:hypothetical protein
MKGTSFMDTSGGAHRKTKFRTIAVEADEETARRAILRLFGVDVNNKTCPCCGPDFFPEEEEDVDECLTREEEDLLIIRENEILPEDRQPTDDLDKALEEILERRWAFCDLMEDMDLAAPPPGSELLAYSPEASGERTLFHASVSIRGTTEEVKVLSNSHGSPFEQYFVLGNYVHIQTEGLQEAIEFARKSLFSVYERRVAEIKGE